ncbi:hypothetical protein QE152_g29817 [Popillia japonica]|uniref:Uncharacterized protein n=1 Tax=Popillia japonica TaxID=7064 RepID=A0AAW1JGC7_POPJA
MKLHDKDATTRIKKELDNGKKNIVVKQRKIKAHRVGVDCSVMGAGRRSVKGTKGSTGNALTPTKEYSLFRG